MDNASNIIDLAARRAERHYRSRTVSRQESTERRFSREALEERQRETIEKLRALGYEMCRGRPD